MPRRQLPPVPEFASEEEEAEFWDTHSPLDYNTGPLQQVEIQKPKNMAISVRLTSGSRRKLDEIAAHYRMGPSRFVRTLIDALLDEPGKVPFVLSPKLTAGHGRKDVNQWSSGELSSEVMALMTRIMREPREEIEALRAELKKTVAELEAAKRRAVSAKR